MNNITHNRKTSIKITTTTTVPSVHVHEVEINYNAFNTPIALADIPFSLQNSTLKSHNFSFDFKSFAFGAQSSAQKPANTLCNAMHLYPNPLFNLKALLKRIENGMYT
jgi:hypothetical protein